jgi:hypothetical protein
MKSSKSAKVAAPATKTWSAITLAQKATDPELIDLDTEALDSLMQRLIEARDFELALSAADLQLLIQALLTLTHLQERLQDNDITLKKLRKLLGIVSASEKLKNLLPAQQDDPGASDDAADDEDNPVRKRRKPKPPRPTTAHSNE